MLPKAPSPLGVEGNVVVNSRNGTLACSKINCAIFEPVDMVIGDELVLVIITLISPL